MANRQKITFPLLNLIDLHVKLAHRDGEFRPVVVAVMRRECDDAVLFVQSANHLEDWSFPQGGIETTERPTVSLVREIREELGIGPEAFTLDWYLGESDLAYEPGRARMRGFTVGKRYFFFALTCTKPDAIALEPSELAALRWGQAKEANDVMATTRPEKRLMLQTMLRRLTL